MCDLVCDRYPVLLIMSRFGIALGFGDKTIGEVCLDSGVDTATFLAVVNMHSDDKAPDPETISVAALVGYLRNSHVYFLDFRLPAIPMSKGCSGGSIPRVIRSTYSAGTTTRSRRNSPN